MPEAMIIYRFYYKENGLEPEWWEEFKRVSSLSLSKKKQLEEIIGANDFSNIESLTSDYDIMIVLHYYTITRDDFLGAILWGMAMTIF